MQRDNLAYWRWGLWPAILAAVLASVLTLSRPARADVAVRFDVGNAPPAPTLVFRSPPRRWYDRTSGVYVIDDPRLGPNDAFFYGGYYWLFQDGYWYRSRNWRGGFRVVQPGLVPTAIYRVPRGRWHNHPDYASWHDRRAMRDGMRTRMRRDLRHDRGRSD